MMNSATASPASRMSLLNPITALAAKPKAVVPPPQNRDAGATLLSKMMAPATPRMAPLPPRQVVRSLGQLAEMTLPQGWEEGRSQQPTVGSSYFREFKAPAARNTTLCVFFRGRAMSLETSLAFSRLLNSARHSRELRSEEIRSLKELLKDKADGQLFSMLSARVQNLNGKMVIIVQGRYKELKEDCLHIFLDADGRTGTFVQEIYFQAPCQRDEHGQSAFVRHIRCAKEAISSIVWKAGS